MRPMTRSPPTAATSTSATRPSRCRSQDKIGDRHGGASTWSTTSGSPRRRPDVLVYQTDVLEEDVTIAGPIEVELHVSTTGTDSDWVVKLIDVYPDDYPDPEPEPDGRADGRLSAAGARRRDAGQVPQQLREARAVRARPAGRRSSSRCRTSATRSAAATGIMVQVQSTWFPLVDRNPQTVRGHLHGQGSRTSRRRRSACTARASCRRG